MSGRRSGLMALALVVTAACVPIPLHAQRISAFGAAHAPAPAATHLVPPPVMAATDSSSKGLVFAQRATFALLGGIVAGGVTLLIDKENIGLGMAAYTLGAVGGTVLAARKTGGTNKSGLASGTFLGNVPILVGLLMDYHSGDTGYYVGGALLSAFAVPVSSALGSMP